MAVDKSIKINKKLSDNHGIQNKKNPLVHLTYEVRVFY